VILTFGLLFLLLAAICFFLGTIRVNSPHIDLMFLGMLFLTLAFICGFGPGLLVKAA
jgi:hypothetical protein